MPRSISDNGIQFTKAWESFSATPYYATAKEKARGILTWGYGHTGSVKDAPKSAITPGQGLLLLNNDIAWAVAAVDEVASPKLNQAQFDAMVDLVFNAGVKVIAATTGTGKALRAGDVATLRQKIPQFIYQDGVVVLGLRRRTAGRLALFDGKPWQEAERIGRAVK